MTFWSEIQSFSSDSIVDRVVVDELQDLLDVVVDDVIGKREEDCPLDFLEVDLGAELFEKVLILVKADGEEVKEVSNVHIVRQAEQNAKLFFLEGLSAIPAEVACQFSVEVHHVLLELSEYCHHCEFWW